MTEEEIKEYKESIDLSLKEWDMVGKNGNTVEDFIFGEIKFPNN